MKQGQYIGIILMLGAIGTQMIKEYGFSGWLAVVVTTGVALLIGVRKP